MGWVTIYITGNENFRKDVREKMAHSALDCMPGHHSGADDGDLVSDLYWVDENMELLAFKQTIGSRLIWKYRLRFYAGVEAFVESQKCKKEYFRVYLRKLCAAGRNAKPQVVYNGL